jgi:hypothetical protein
MIEILSQQTTEYSKRIKVNENVLSQGTAKMFTYLTAHCLEERETIPYHTDKRITIV